MDRTLQFFISENQAGKTILQFLREHGFSRNLLISMKECTNAILLNGQPVRARTLLHTGDALTVFVPETETPSSVLPVRIPLSVLYEDEDILVIDKPAGMPVHPSQGNHDNTLANAAACYFQNQESPFVFRCINRLDKDTTGVVALAKNPYSGAVLSAQMKQRQIQGSYLAIVCGIAPESGTIDAPVARVPGSALRREVNFSSGKSAVTHFKRLQILHPASEDGQSRTFSLLEVRLDTGRTHQIRVHMHYIGHPLPGDFLYYPDYTCFPRQPLHFQTLQFFHPVTGQALSFTAPLPPLFQICKKPDTQAGS